MLTKFKIRMCYYLLHIILDIATRPHSSQTCKLGSTKTNKKKIHKNYNIGIVFICFLLYIIIKHDKHKKPCNKPCL